MKNRSILYPIYFLTTIFFASSCQYPKDLLYRYFKNLQIEKICFASTAIKLDLTYYNPNNFGLQLKYTDLDIFLDNRYLGHSSQNYQISIPRLAEFSIPLKIEVDMKNLLTNALPTLFGKEVMVKVTGNIKIGKANIYRSIPVKYEGMQRFSAF